MPISCAASLERKGTGVVCTHRHRSGAAQRCCGKLRYTLLYSSSCALPEESWSVAEGAMPGSCAASLERKGTDVVCTHVHRSAAAQWLHGQDTMPADCTSCLPAQSSTAS